MANLREIKRRITSVKSTQQITRAMKMVAASKLRRAQAAITKIRPYALKNKELLRKLQLYSGEKIHPLIAVNSGNKEEVVVVSSDKGLCGGLNTNLFRQVIDYVKNKEVEKEISLTIIGKKGRDFFVRRDFSISATFIDEFENLNYTSIYNIVEYFTQLYINNQRSSIVFAYNGFRSAIAQHPTIEKLLPIDPIEPKPGEHSVDYTYEPEKEEIVTTLFVEGVHLQIYRMFLEAVSSEHAARMTAMENATNNADDMISRLTLIYNRARQSAITKELIEVVSGAEVLR